MTARFKLKLKRRRLGKTNYKKRLKLLSSRKMRLVVRKSLKNISVQLVKYEPKGDKILTSANSTELEKLGWKYSRSSLTAAYLTGLLCGAKAVKADLKEAVLDLGLHSPIKGSKVYAALKGAIDSGLKIPASPEIFPKDERIRGMHIAKYAAMLKKEKPEQYKKSFSKYIKDNLDPEKIPEAFESVKSKIQGAKK